MTKAKADPAAPAADSSEAVTDPKERFRQALEAKKAKSGHRGTDSAGGGGTDRGNSGREGGKREFRRKSGG
jgi:hypothetical protein